MISICIPVYNADVTSLVTDLYMQCRELECAHEIWIIDDFSDPQYRATNRELTVFDAIHYLELDTNIGRAAIRNLLAQKASYPYLVFIDCDAVVYTRSFVSRYIKACSPGVVCYGGCQSLPGSGDDTFCLRWKYGNERESIPIEEREKNPDLHFSTFNFMIDKRVILLYPFDENIQSYGYEDVLFRLQLIKQGYHLTQIDNALIHSGLISANEFLDRTRTSLQNLHQLVLTYNQELDLTDAIKLLRFKKRVDALKMNRMIVCLFKIVERGLVKNILGNNPSLLIFDIYKLGYICTLFENNPK